MSTWKRTDVQLLWKKNSKRNKTKFRSEFFAFQKINDESLALLSLHDCYETHLLQKISKKLCNRYFDKHKY